MKEQNESKPSGSVELARKYHERIQGIHADGLPSAIPGYGTRWAILPGWQMLIHSQHGDKLSSLSGAQYQDVMNRLGVLGTELELDVVWWVQCILTRFDEITNPVEWLTAAVGFRVGLPFNPSPEADPERDH